MRLMVKHMSLARSLIDSHGPVAVSRADPAPVGRCPANLPPLACIAGQHGIVYLDLGELLAARGFRVVRTSLGRLRDQRLDEARVLILEGRLHAAAFPIGRWRLPAQLPVMATTTTPPLELAPILRAQPRLVYLPVPFNESAFQAALGHALAQGMTTRPAAVGTAGRSLEAAE
jgi:hypothetical protein